MFDVIDIGTFILLEGKYGTELEGYDEKKNDYFLNACIESNNDCLELMKQYQSILFKSIRVKNKDDKYFEKLQECKKNFDECLDIMNRLSKCLEIATTSKRNTNEPETGDVNEEIQNKIQG